MFFIEEIKSASFEELWSRYKQILENEKKDQEDHYTPMYRISHFNWVIKEEVRRRIPFEVYRTSDPTKIFEFLQATDFQDYIVYERVLRALYNAIINGTNETDISKLKSNKKIALEVYKFCDKPYICTAIKNYKIAISAMEGHS